MTQTLRRLESVFRGADGVQLARRSWIPDEADHQLFLVHGFGEHSARYDAMGEWFAVRGWSVYAYDHRGHGRSAGHRNFVRGFDEYVADLAVFISGCERGDHAGVRLAVGHSMGGLILARGLVEGRLDCDAAVLSGAALEVSPDLSRPKQALARVLSRFLPKLRTDPGFTAEDLSRDPEVVRRYEADPLVDTGMTLALASAMLRAQEVTLCEGGRVTTPLLGLHGADDPICPATGTERFMAAVPNPVSGCTIYPGLLHEIFNEPEREQVWQDILAFVDRVRGARRDPRGVRRGQEQHD